MARGNLHQVMGAGENAFERIGYALEGYYLLGIEADPTDRGGPRPDVKVRTVRKGLTINRAARLPRRGRHGGRHARAGRDPRAALPVAGDRPAGAPGDVVLQGARHRQVRLLVAAEVERGTTSRSPAPPGW